MRVLLIALSKIVLVKQEQVVMLMWSMILNLTTGETIDDNLRFD